MAIDVVILQIRIYQAIRSMYLYDQGNKYVISGVPLDGDYVPVGVMKFLDVAKRYMFMKPKRTVGHHSHVTLQPLVAYYYYHPFTALTEVIKQLEVCGITVPEFPESEMARIVELYDKVQSWEDFDVSLDILSKPSMASAGALKHNSDIDVPPYKGGERKPYKKVRTWKEFWFGLGCGCFVGTILGVAGILIFG